MRRQNLLVFDDIINLGADVYSSSRHDASLGRFDQLVVQAIVDDAFGDPGSLLVTLEHSGDARNWNTRAAPLMTTPVTAGQTTTFAATDVWPVLMLAFVRVKLRLTTTTFARARVYVTARDAA